MNKILNDSEFEKNGECAGSVRGWKKWEKEHGHNLTGLS